MPQSSPSYSKHVLFWVGYVLEPPEMRLRQGPFCVEAGPEGLLGYGAGCPPGAPSMGPSSLLHPGLCDAHLHAPDAAIADAGEELGLHELVSQPHGLKYRLLADAGTDVPEAVGELLEAYRREGVLAAIAYAEPGYWEPVRRASARQGIVVRVAAQPAEKRTREALLPLHRGYWLGLDTPLDMEPWELRLLAGYAHSRGARVVAHVSEDEALARLGDLELALDAGIDILVHLTHAGPGDVLEAARAGRGVVFCPLANLYFTASLPPLEALPLLHAEEAQVGLGGDNAAWPPHGMGLLLAATYTLYRSRLGNTERLALARSLLYAATVGCGKLAAVDTGWQARRVPLLAYSHAPEVGLVKRLHQSTEPKVLEPPRPSP